MRVTHLSLSAATPRERANQRHRNVAYTATASILARAIAVGTTLVTIRVALSYLGSERFGLWMTISSLQMFLAFADFGIGNGLLNAVAEASGRDDIDGIRRYISSSVLLLGTISGLFLVSTALAWHLIPLGNFFQLHSALALSEVGPAVGIFAACFAIDVSLGLVQRVQLGLQLGFLSNLWQIAGNVLGLLGVLLVIRLRGGLPVLVFAFCGAPLLAKLVNGCWFFGKERPELLPSFRLASWSVIQQLGRLAILFFVLQIAVAVGYQSDNLIITHLVGPDAVTQYSVPQKLFSLISFGIMTLIGPLWPAYGEAIARGDHHWVRNTLVRSLLTALVLASATAATLALVARQVIHYWVGGQIQVSSILLIGLAGWAVVDALGNAVAMFLNGASIVKPQIIIAAGFAICAAAVKLSLVHRWGINAMPWATMTAYLVCTGVPYAILVPRIVGAVCGGKPEGHPCELSQQRESTVAG